MAEWKARRAVVIGASSGIGEALARELARSGSAVALVARRQNELDRVAAEIAKAGGGVARTYVHDVEDVASVPTLLERIRTDLGGLDFVAYAAGVMPTIEESEYSFEKDRQMMAVNVVGAMAWFNPVAALFEAQRGGTLVALSSIAGVRGRRGNPAYCTSKAALTSYLESLRNRLSRYGVNVVTAKLGFVDTAMTRGMRGLFWMVSADDAARRILKMASTGRGASGFVPGRWALIAAIVWALPSFIFRRLNI